MEAERACSVIRYWSQVVHTWLARGIRDIRTNQDITVSQIVSANVNATVEDRIEERVDHNRGIANLPVDAMSIYSMVDLLQLIDVKCDDALSIQPIIKFDTAICNVCI